MKIIKTDYFDRFRCIAGACPDSCCKEWDVQVDEASAEYYRSLTGPLGDRLREVLHTEAGETVMTITDGRCPMWRADGLCRIQAELGEQALCKTCREFPRLTHDYGDFIELGLELSCPEAAKFILTLPASPLLSQDVPGGQEPEYDREAMSVLKATRETARDILSDTCRPAGQTLAALLLYGYQAQGELDGAEPMEFDAGSALDAVRTLATAGDLSGLLSFFRELEILTPQWSTRLENGTCLPLSPLTLPLARYFVDRYWLQAVSDYDLACRVKFMVVSCILVSCLGGNFIETAQLYSKEIENSIDNVEAILDAAYSHPAFTDDRLLGLLFASP